MRFLRRNTADQATEDETRSVVEDTPERTPGKGKPTPKRREAERRRRGPVPPPPQTQREASKRARGTREERRKANEDRRRRMMEGDDRALLPRDRGPVKAYVRDLVDSRRHLMGVFMPIVLVVFAVTLVRTPAIQQYSTIVMFVVLLAMIVEGGLLGRSVNKKVRAKFSNVEESPLALGWYAFTRAMQLRKLRVPRPRVRPKDAATVG